VDPSSPAALVGAAQVLMGVTHPGTAAAFGQEWRNYAGSHSYHQPSA
jgi:hypothetical protein